MGKWEKFINFGFGGLVYTGRPARAGPVEKEMCLICQARRGAASGSRVQPARTSHYRTTAQPGPGHLGRAAAAPGRVQAGAGRRRCSSYTRRPRTPAQAPARRQGGQAFPWRLRLPGRAAS